MKKLILAILIFFFLIVNTAQAATYLTYYGIINPQVIYLTFDYYDGNFIRTWRSDSYGTFERYGVFFNAECSRVNNYDEEVCWSYVGFILEPLIFGIENWLESCDENSEIIGKTPFFGFKVSDMLY